MGNKEFKIRKMEARDIEAVAQLTGELGYQSTAQQVRERWQSVSISNNEVALVITTSENDRAVGFAHFGKELSLTGDARTFLRSFVISEKLRGNRLGHLLLAEVESMSQALGFSKLRIGTQISREGAHRFYKKNGYSLFKTWHILEKIFPADHSSKAQKA